ncbi:unnamed protein product [Callosobruchus maculatus]|uniref:Uncharacterized protein n=1 Tax=Callosobruchus maculatus TaxID=64391 RepID=A0A653D8G6_CALMS|nr:unnamed protein product [Callosobruchus maculatus]
MEDKLQTLETRKKGAKAKSKDENKEKTVLIEKTCPSCNSASEVRRFDRDRAIIHGVSGSRSVAKKRINTKDVERRVQQ